MNTPENIDRAARFWKVGQLYRSKHFKNEYIKVIDIGENMLFVCEYYIDENKKPFMSWLMDLHGKRYQRKVLVKVIEGTKNKFFFGWEAVANIPEISEGSPSVQYNYIRRTNPIDVYDIPEGQYPKGKLLVATPFDRSAWLVVKEGLDTLFVRTVIDGRIVERVRTKNMYFWCKTS